MIDKENILAKNGTLKQALDTLEAALQKPFENDLMRDGAIQRFEYCFELAWKTVKLVIEYEDKEASGGPRAILAKGATLKILDDEEDWFRMLLERNNSVHTYKAELAIEIASHLEMNLHIMKNLHERILNRYK